MSSSLQLGDVLPVRPHGSVGNSFHRKLASLQSRLHFPRQGSKLLYRDVDFPLHGASSIWSTRNTLREASRRRRARPPEFGDTAATEQKRRVALVQISFEVYDRRTEARALDKTELREAKREGKRFSSPTGTPLSEKHCSTANMSFKCFPC